MTGPNVGGTHRVKAGECAWTVAKQNLSAKNQKVSNTAIAAEMKRLANINGCSSVEDFNTKFFSGGIGKSFKTEDSKPKAQPKGVGGGHSKDSVVVKSDSIRVAQTDSTKVALRDSTRVAQTDSTRVALRDTTRVAQIDSTKVNKPVAKNADVQFAAEAKRINNIKGDANRIIEYNKTHGKGNYVIVDKKTCQATVYDRSGKALKSYEVLLGSAKGDDMSTSVAADPKLAKSGERTVPGEYTLSKRYGSHGGTFMMGGVNETIDPDITLRKWEPGAWGKKEFRGIYQAIHGTANPAVRDQYYDNGKLSDNRQSMGCVNIPVENLNEMAKEFGIGQNTQLYVLPETKGNELVLTKRKDGVIKFQTKYKDEAQNEKQARVQNKIAAGNIQRQLQAKKKAEQKRLLAEQKRREEMPFYQRWFS